MSDEFEPDTVDATGPRRQKTFWLLVAVLAGAALLLVTLRPIPPSGIDGRAHPAVGGRLIGLHVEPLTGSHDDVFLDDLVGKVTVVNFWSTMCPPCRREFPHMVALQKKLSDRDDFRLLLVSYPLDGPVDSVALASDTAAFLKQQGTALPTYFDPRLTLMRATTLALGEVANFPTTLVLDRDTTIRGVWQGYAPGTERDVEALVDELLDQPDTTKPDKQTVAKT